MSDRQFIKPQLFCSKCITFDYCRWNAAIIASERIELLKNYAEFFTHCPEQEIGLGVPRNPVRIVMIEGEPRLFQPADQLDHTDKMTQFSLGLIPKLQQIDGFIFKSKSPSCGLASVRYFKSIQSPEVAKSGPGFFSQAVLKAYANYPITDEGRINSERAWEHFLTQIHTRAEFRATMNQKKIQKLIKFHSRNKLLLMAYNQHNMRLMGQKVGQYEGTGLYEILQEYYSLLLQTLFKMPTYTSHINVLQHALGYFKNDLSSNEKKFFLQEIEKYRKGLIPLSTCIHLLRGFIIRFEEPYLAEQTYLYPYPDQLIQRANFSSTREKAERSRSIKKL